MVVYVKRQAQLGPCGAVKDKLIKLEQPKK